MGKLRDNMFAVVGQPMPEPECKNIYETIEDYTSQIERDLMHAVSNIDDAKTTRHRDRDMRHRSVKNRDEKPKNKHRYVRDRLPLPEPIVIFEEPEQPITDSDSQGYVIAYRHRPTTVEDVYETIGSPESESEHVNFLNAKNGLTSSQSSGVRSSSCEVNAQSVSIPLFERPDVESITAQPITGKLRENQPITGQERYQGRMEAVAKKVSLLKGRGQLKLSVYINSGLLTIHFAQARHLSCKGSLNCNSYVRLSLVPDDIKRTRCKTDVIHETNNPMFDEKFSFELLEEDIQKRLLVSMWSRDETERRSEFLGCMSFGINHIQSSKRVVNGWYYLLTEDVGRRKHLRVLERKSGISLSEKPRNTSPSAHTDLHWMDRHIVVVRRGLAGYGFTVSGTSPPQVCRIEPGSSAEIAGLQKNDCIVRINGNNVSRGGSDSVARIVRHSEKQVVLEVQRSRLLEELLSSPWKPTMCSTFLPSPTRSDISDDEQEPEIRHAQSKRFTTRRPLCLEDLEEEPEDRWNLIGSRGSTGSGGSGHSSGSGRYYRESLV